RRKMEAKSAGERNPESDLASVVNRNISALIERQMKEEKQKSATERLADRITSFTGSMVFVYVHVLAYGLWIIINPGWIPSGARFGPDVVNLAMEASVEAIFLSTFVLITQNRMATET